MKSGQFYRGKMDGIQKHYESPDLEDILPTDKLCILADYNQVGEHFHFFKEDRVLTRTQVTEAENTDGRLGGIINHTVLYKFDRSLTHESAKYIFDTETFIQEIRQGQRKFKMPDPPTLPEDESIIIDAPQPIIWEDHNE